MPLSPPTSAKILLREDLLEKGLGPRQSIGSSIPSDHRILQPNHLLSYSLPISAATPLSVRPRPVTSSPVACAGAIFLRWRNLLAPYTQDSRLPTTTSKSIKPKDGTQNLDTTRKRSPSRRPSRSLNHRESFHRRSIYHQSPGYHTLQLTLGKNLHLHLGRCWQDSHFTASDLGTTPFGNASYSTPSRYCSDKLQASSATIMLTKLSNCDTDGTNLD
ncbi:hypothetical protein ACKAV7_013880 [Fusarium commune]